MRKPMQDHNIYNPDYVSPPGATLNELLQDKGISQAELAEKTGRPKKTINEIIKGKAAITPETAIQFERVLGTPAHFWITRESDYREWLAKMKEREILIQYIPWMKKFPIRSMIKFGWLPELNDNINQVDALLKFFGVATPLQWQNSVNGAYLRQTPAFAADPAAVSAWLRQGEIIAEGIECEEYSDAKFRKILLKVKKITMTEPDYFVKELVRLCSTVGVAVVFLPELPGTRTCGATRWINSKKALLMLSLRYKTNDHLWFTFFHEAAHIILHEKKEIFIDAIIRDEEIVDEKEQQADFFAADFLIPEKALRSLILSKKHLSHSDIIEFANKQGIAPGIVVGRLQHDKLVPPQNFNRLKQRYEWIK